MEFGRRKRVSPIKEPMDSGILGIHQSKSALSCTKHVWYSEHGTYYRFEIILEQVMSATHVAVIPRTRTSPAYEEEFTKMDYPDARNEYGMS